MSRISVKGTQSAITTAHFEVSVKAGGDVRSERLRL